MTAALYDEVATAGPTLTLVPAPEPTAEPTAKQAPRQINRPFGSDPLVDGATRLLSFPLRQLYAALWRAGVLDVSA